MTGLLDNVKLHLVENIEDLFAFKRWVGERRETPLAVDTESEGLNPFVDKLRLVQFGDLHTGWAIPWDLWKGGILEVINGYEGEWVCHNLPFEQKFFKVHGGVQLPWDRCHDTMVQAKIDDPMRPAGLKPLSERLVDRTAAQGQKALHDGMQAQGWTWATVPVTFAPYWVYSALDTVLTAHVHEKLYKPVMDVASRAYALEMAVLRICTAMMLKGMRLDVPYVHEAKAKLQQFSADARVWLKATHGITSPMSGGQLSRAFEGFGCEITEFTDTGAPKMDKAVLEFFKKAAPIPEARQLAEYILAIRHTDKIIGSYLDNFLKLRDSDDIIHANINTLAARTSRMSVTDPALQTLHRNDKIVRGSFVPGEGNVFLSSDLDQVEARMAAHFTEDPGLIQAFHTADTTGGDFFCEVASAIYGERIEKSDKRRDMVKTIVYRTNYGGGDNVEAMALTAGVPYEQMEHAKEWFDRTFPGVAATIPSVAAEAKENYPPYIRSPLGRRLSMESGKEFTQAFNARIQGHAAEYFKQTLVDMDACGLGDNLVLPVHDEALLEVPAGDAEEALKLVEQCMTNRTGYRVPLTAGGKIMTDRWQK